MSDSNRETEVKFYVSNLLEIEMRLQQMEAHLIQPRVLEGNLRFDNPNGDFQREGRVLRLRQDEAIRLTYKDSSQLLDGALSRREIEFAVSDFDSAKQFIEALGYEVVFLYEKFRTTYLIQTSETSEDLGSLEVHVMLDETPIGDFVEIECAVETLKPIAKKLGLNWAAAVPAGYHNLFERVREARGLNFRDLSFENFKGIKVLADDVGVKSAD